MSIRLAKQYHHSMLIEVDSHSLFSKFFGESGKLVGLLFETIEGLLEKENDTFVCILIDEVESLTSARDQVAGHNEPRDGLRVCLHLGRWDHPKLTRISGRERTADSAGPPKIPTKRRRALHQQPDRGHGP